MATKPTDLPEWATDETNNTEPSAGQKASGWTNGQVPPSSYFNWYMFSVWLWIEWLNSAVVDFGANTVAAGVLDTDEGDVRHGNVAHPISPLEMAVSAGTITTVRARHTSGFTVWVPLRLKIGDTIETARMWLDNEGGAAWSNPKIYELDVVSRVATDITGTNSGGASPEGWFVMTPSSGGHVVASGKTYYLEAISGVNGGGCIAAEVTLSRS